jgi:hypothetical protein
LFLFPGLDVFLGDLATAFAFAGIFEFAIVIAGFATADALAIVLPGAIVDLWGFFVGRHLAWDGIGCGIGAALLEGRSA